MVAHMARVRRAAAMDYREPQGSAGTGLYELFERISYMKIDYGTSYFDALKKYVRIQKEYDNYRRKMQMRFILIIGILAASAAIHLALFIISLFFS